MPEITSGNLKDLNQTFASSMRPDCPVWIYAFKNALTSGQKNLLQNKIRDFLQNWKSHGTPVHGEAFILEDHFVILAAELGEEGGPSGCSIDSSVKVFKEFKQQTGLNGMDRSLVFYREALKADKGKVEALSRAGFAAKLSGLDTDKLSVFDTTINDLANLREEGFEKLFGNSWHSRVFKMSEKVGE